MEMVSILNGYVQEQTHHFHSFLRIQNIEEFIEFYNKTKTYFEKLILTFEKEYKTTYKTIRKNL